jgi:hypothetical protein
MSRNIKGIAIQGSVGFYGCTFCGGRGCLACQKQADREYKRQFPDGPKPILTIPLYNVDGDTEAQASMIDDGCPNTEEPYMVHPTDAAKLRSVIDEYSRPRTEAELLAELRSALSKAFAGR